MVSQPAQAASFSGFGCIDNPDCQYYVERINAVVDAETVSEVNFIVLLGGRYSSTPLGFDGSSSISATADINLLDDVNRDGILETYKESALAFASVTTGLQLGQLRAKAFASVQSNTTYPLGYPSLSRAGTQNNLSWGDYITVTSSTLASGTLVPFELRLDLDRTVSASGLFEGNTQAFVGASLRIGDPGYSGLGGVSIFDTNYYPSNVFSKTTTVYLPVGITTAIEGNLEVLAAAQTGLGVSTSDTSIADASNTANYYLTPLLADVSYTSASGRSYFYSPTAVPEPTTILGTLAFGSLGAGSWLKRRQKGKKARSV
ncbi:PEP-CTERM sorting domain-containing protein [Merismopedia glauca]|uniref:PEP-CTERM sorting domain-containing protein n=1 Tax=Merismopedia glauca TaxID=292586 RepID=UPI0015E73DF8|nr:PEP-CTERM sorting domain-containing protein [Merismopedia glauca]